MLVCTAAKESKCILFSCSATSLTSKYHGEGKKILGTLFVVTTKTAPSMVFFNEINALLESRKGNGSEHEAYRKFKTRSWCGWMASSPATPMSTSLAGC